ncbi:hypothetical protein [Reyranella sp.]|nr:hypothetical protein [Reyranella sp.]
MAAGTRRSAVGWDRPPFWMTVAPGRVWGGVITQPAPFSRLPRRS